MKIITLICTLLLNTTVALCQNPSDSVYTKDVMTLTLEELMNIPVTVGSQKTLTVKETPGSITLITEEMIRSSGARDLDELLLRVPGFSPANDYGNVVSFGVRGNWANEGKILVLIDGMIINETSYGSGPVTQRVPLSQIRQIEIIRGPGSVIYGGVAALAVISIKTKSGEDLNGAQIAINSGVSNDLYARNNVATSFGKKYDNGLMISLHAGLNQGNNSNRNYRSPVGDSVLNYRNHSEVLTRFVNFNIGYKNLDVRYVHEDLQIDRTNDAYGDKYTHFSGDHMSASYTMKAGKLKITPGFYFRSQEPWNVLGGDYEIASVTSYRTSGNIKLQYEASGSFDVMAGSEYYDITSRYTEKGGPTFTNGSRSFSMSNASFFTEAIFHKNGWNASGGFRFDKHSFAGSAFVPRMAITKSFNRLNLKVTYSRAFKTPLVTNIQANEKIKPEYVTMLELESSYTLGKNLMVTINLFDVKITESIIYQYTPDTGEESFTNKGITGTRGVEAELRYTGNKMNFMANYSFYRAAYHEVSSFNIPGDRNVFQGLSPHKVTLTSSFQVTDNFQINPSLVILGKRTTTIYNNVSKDYELYETGTFTGFNIVMAYRNLFTKGLSLQAGVHDLFDQQLVYVAAYNAGLLPQPVQAREFTVGLRYDLGSKR